MNESARRYEILAALKSDNITIHIFSPVKHEILDVLSKTFLNFKMKL